MQECQIAEEVAALELIENLTERAWEEIEERIMYVIKTFIEEQLEEELTQRMGPTATSATRKGWATGEGTTRGGSPPASGT